MFGPHFFTGDHEGLRLLGLTVATDETDGFKRFMRSAEIFNIPIKVGLCPIFCKIFAKFKHEVSNRSCSISIETKGSL